ncbi:major facilitator superfamily domain-containing protein, partial [Podospora aff. communis PSN243]
EETVLPIIAPTITADFNSIKHLMWYASASYLTSCASQLHWNHVYTSHSPNGSFLVAIILLGAGSIITATASSTGPFIAGRIVTGLAIPGVRGGCTAILAAASLGEKRTKITGAMNIASGLGYLAGSVAAGVVTDQSPGRWRWSYFMLLPLYAFTFVLILASLWGRKRKTQQFATSFMTKVKRLDPLGTILLLVSLYLAVAGIQLGSWVGDSFYILLVASGAFLVLFVFIRRRTHQDPLVPAGVSGRRTMNMAFLFSGCMGGGLVLMLYWISFWVQSVGGPRALRAGLGTLPLAVGMFISSAPLGMVSQRMGDYSSFGMIAAVVLTSVGAGLATINNDSTNIELEKWIGSLLLFGLGIGCGVQMPSIVASTVLDPADVPNAVGLLQAASSLGSGVLFAVGQAVFAKTAQSGIQEENIVAYMWGRAPVGTTPDVKFNGPTEDERRTYEEALKNTVYVIVAVSCVAIVPAVAMAWRRLGGKREALLFPAARGPRPPRNGWYV